MGLLDIASGKSFWRGYDYFRSGNVLSCEKMGDLFLLGTVRGSDGSVYNVGVNLGKVRSSICSCPFKEDKPKAVCKHMVAVYFAAFPEEADRVQREYEEWQAGEGERRQARIRGIEEYVGSLSVEELREMVLAQLLDEEFNDRRNWR